MIDDQTRSDLITAALEVRPNAYAPYSKFKVGVALLGSDNKIYRGVNVENAIYRVTHGEQAAIVQAVLNSVRTFKAIAVAVDAAKPAWPCGQCRQDLAEFCDGDFEIIAVNEHGEVQQKTLDELLPERFGPKDLGIDPTDD
jgi:cytidine deaminase